MFDGEPDATRTAFVGHTHRPLDRALSARGGSPVRRFVNVGSAGEPMDRDTRACYIVAQRDVSDEPGDWRVGVRRVPYDIEAAVRAYDNGLRDICPELVELMARNLRNARNYFGRCMREVRDLPPEQFIAGVRAWLAEHP